MSKKLEIIKRKLLYRASYRGTKEMDILLSSFVKKYIEIFNEDQLKELEIFLKFEDQTILNFYNYNIPNENIEKISISKSTIKYDYAKLAGRIIISNNHKNTSPSFSETVSLLFNNESPLVSEELYP